MDAEVEQFVTFTAAPDATARAFLEMTGGDVMQAVQLFFDQPELRSSITAASSSAAGAQPSAVAAAAAASGPASSGANMNTAIRIDSDDDDNVHMLDSDLDQDDDEQDPEISAIRRAQEEEDARMAQEMQEDLYKQGPADEDGVRAPIARTTEMLVEPAYGGPPGMGAYGDDDDDDEVQARMAELERRRRNMQQQQRANVPRGPFSQSIWEGDEPPRASGSGSNSNGHPDSRSQRLADLFRPPYDLMCHLGWEDAREEGKDSKKWLLVNLQDMSNFHCQALNRDIWKDQDIVELIEENFLFLQYSKDDDRAQQYKTFYFHGQSYEDPDSYPHVSIIDPRTGEQVKVFSGPPFPDAREFHAGLVEFLDRYSLDPRSKNPVAKSKRPPKPRNLDAMTEDEMLEMALQESMASSGNANANGDGSGSGSGSVAASGSATEFHDPDALTRSVGDVPGAEPAPEEVSPFHQISSASPHVEPPHNPATTTRIQFKHPTGRVIRRFGLDEKVRRLYEWLKSEPFEGRAGVEFELKTSPQGKDIIEMLDQTVTEAGLKQGTVMIEFIED